MQPLVAHAIEQATPQEPATDPPAERGPAPEPSAVRLLSPLARAKERAEELVGQTIAERYRIQKLLAMGGMGAVYVGQHLLLKKRVAIKLLHPETEGLPGLVTRFEREAIAGAHIIHPNVAAATDFGQLPDGSYFLVLEYVAGLTLHDLIAQGRVPPARAVHLARQIAAALGAAHAMGVVHRDVKPGNVMLVKGLDDFVKLIDFGLARVPVDQMVSPASQRLEPFDEVDRMPSLTAVGVVFGTVEYMAPETALGMHAVGPRSDLYALGIILYEMLTGQHPFDGTSPAALFSQQRFTPPPPFARAAPDLEVPPELEAVVMRLLAKDPDARYATSGDLIGALDALGFAAPPLRQTSVSYRPSAPVASAEVSTKTTKPRLRSHLPLMFAAGAFVVGAAAFAHYRDAGVQVPAAPSASATITMPSAAASAEPAASAAPSAAVSAGSAASAVVSAPVSPGPAADAAAVDAAELASRRELFLRTVRARDWTRAEAAFFELATLDQHAYHGPEMVAPAAELAATLDRAGKGDKIFNSLANRLGADGVDVLYDLVATRGLSGAALRAATVLRHREVLARGSPQARVAFQLRDASCVDKLGLLDLAAADGDERTLLVLETQGAACFDRSNKAVNEAARALRARLGLGK